MGKDHRFMVEYTYGDIELYLVSNNITLYAGTFPGATLCLGYQLMTNSGFIFNISGGVSLIEDYLFFNSNIGFGWKF